MGGGKILFFFYVDGIDGTGMQVVVIARIGVLESEVGYIGMGLCISSFLFFFCQPEHKKQKTRKKKKTFWVEICVFSQKVV